MKSLDCNKTVENSALGQLPPGEPLRRGRVGGWRRSISVALNDEMDQWLDEQLADADGLVFEYTLGADSSVRSPTPPPPPSSMPKKEKQALMQREMAKFREWRMRRRSKSTSDAPQSLTVSPEPQYEEREIADSDTEVFSPSGTPSKTNTSPPLSPGSPSPKPPPRTLSPAHMRQTLRGAELGKKMNAAADSIRTNSVKLVHRMPKLGKKRAPPTPHE